MTFSFMHKQRGPEKYTDELVDQWAALYGEGKSYRVIATAFEVPYPTVFWHLHTKRGLGDGRPTGRKKTYVGMSAYDVVRQRNLRKYDLSLEQREDMELAQDGKCAICGDLPKGGKTSSSSLHVDHDHKTGKVRGLLCNNCNHAIGKLHDSPFLMEKAAAYLRRFQKAA